MSPYGRGLGRIPSRDPRNADYPIRRLRLIGEPLISKTWPLAVRLDQGPDGACVGFSWTQELNAAPVRIGAHITTYDFAMSAYHAAQYADEYVETPPEEGSSVLAGAKVLRDKGYMKSFHWAQSVEDVMRGVAYEGPGVAGTVWLDGMFEPRPSGLLEVNGSVAGGHAWLIRGVVLKPRLKGETNLPPCLVLTNTWWDGKSPDVWGVRGSAYIKAEDFDRHLLSDDGEFCLPVGRADPRLKDPWAS